MTTPVTPRKGERMTRAIEYVAAHPGCTKLDAAGYVFPRSLRHGYAAVDRAISAGLILAEHHGNRYALTIPPA